MDVEVNWLAILLATAASMVAGFVWYSKGVFGARWMKLVGLKDKDMEKGATPAILITIVVSFITAYVLAHLAFLSNSFFGNSFLQDSLTTAFWGWMGLTAARFITHDLFERRAWQLTALALGYELVTFMAMGLVIGLMKP
jgi:hypothetical protein